MSANSQWNSSLYSPKSPLPSSLLGFGYNGGNGSSGNSGLPSSSSGNGGFSAFPSFNNGSSRSGSGSSGAFFPPQQPNSVASSNMFSMNNSGQSGGGGGSGGSTSPPIGHFHIGTFNANSAFGDEPSKPIPASLGNGHSANHNREGVSPNNLGSRETGIIEKLLVLRCKGLSFEYWISNLKLSFSFLIFSIPTVSSNAVNVRHDSFFILVNLTAI